MEMQQVRYFLAVARTLNFTRAAEECNVSQPALTRAIKVLEAELGGELIRREGRLSHLTELGQRMLPLLRQCHDAALTAKALATSVKKGEVATIPIAVAQTFEIGLLLPMFGELSRHFPGLTLKLRRGNSRAISEMLKSGEVEIAIGGPLGEYWDRLETWPMFTESFDLVVGAESRFAKRNDLELDVEVFKGARFLLHRALGVGEEDIQRLASVGIDVHNAHEIDSDSDLEALVAADFGVAISPATALRDRDIQHLRLPEIDLKRTVAVYTVAGRHRSREVAAMLNLLRGADWSGIGG